MDLYLGGKQHCYTVAECSIDDENCDSSTTTSSDCNEQPHTLMPSTIGAILTNDGRPSQLGYFVPLPMFYLKPKQKECHTISPTKTADTHHERAGSYSSCSGTQRDASSVATTIPIHSPMYSPLYMNKNVLNSNENETPLLYDSLNNYSLLCHGGSSPTNTVKKRDKLRHRFSDVGSWGRKRKNKKGIRQFHSMNETIEVLADPVVEDDIFLSGFVATILSKHKMIVLVSD
ncbi:hypothetical protein Bhyg_10771 [Pseudolycoriella hygida]|uniref:Uncharacterized protein n=1 Tax=Pseudolycoriella hygida TaxID=35572 RepID=A0A9Q0RZJ8_9DIPT|nr:hypothetical protein Bhyg_10771 [Pseudolycoriella hygida]